MGTMRQHPVGARPAEPFLTTGDVAKHCGVDRKTVARWLDGGLLIGHTTGGGRRRVRQEDLLAFMAAHGMPIPSTLSERTKIAIVDDDAQFVRVLRRAVQAILPSAASFVAKDGFEAGVVIATHRPHVVLLDVFMPGLSGVEVCKQIRANPALASTAVVAITGAPTDELKAQLARAGADHVIDKGSSLRPKLDDLLRRYGSTPAERRPG